MADGNVYGLAFVPQGLGKIVLRCGNTVVVQQLHAAGAAGPSRPAQPAPGSSELSLRGRGRQPPMVLSPGWREQPARLAAWAMLLVGGGLGYSLLQRPSRLSLHTHD